MPESGDARAELAAARERAVARLASLEREFGGIVDAARDAGADDEHDPEGATLAFERQHLAALADGSYGTCQVCGARISAERLAARPAARTCVGCVRPR